jgi:hypothetical protein
MSLRNLLGLGRRLLRGKKESATPATGQQTKQITYEPTPSQATGQELAVQEIRNPPIVLKKTKPLQMGHKKLLENRNVLNMIQVPLPVKRLMYPKKNYSIPT